jgi:hypothetical protein
MLEAGKNTYTNTHKAASNYAHMPITSHVALTSKANLQRAIPYGRILEGHKSPNGLALEGKPSKDIRP